MPYRETYPLPVNVYLLFYVYTFTLLLIANVLPVSPVTYFLFLFLGISGTSVLLIKFTYSISINRDTIKLSVNIPFKVNLLQLKMVGISSVEKSHVDDQTYQRLAKLKGYKVYYFKKGTAVTFGMANGKAVLIAGVDADKVTALANQNRELNPE